MNPTAVSLFRNCKAISLDFIGTLVKPNPDVREQAALMYRSLQQSNYGVPYDEFIEAYENSHRKYQEIRLTKLVEVTNAVWLSEALEKLGFTAKHDNEGVERAVEAYFKPYISSMKPVASLKKVLGKLHKNFRLALLSNFTYAPIVYRALEKFHLTEYFDAVVISHSVGWRKPHPRIFKAMLKALKVSSSEAIHVGDDIYEDITGAKRVGIKTILVQEPGASIRWREFDLWALQPPDLTVKNVCALEDL